MEGNRDNSVPGRGASGNPKNRFKEYHREIDPDNTDLEEYIEPDTKLIRDSSRSIITENDSPDVSFDVSLNPYRGCEHGCIYCYARPTHETLGFSAGLDFESRILIKENAPELLREELSDPDWEPEVVALSGVTDPYQPIEEGLELTRDCLKVFRKFRNPVSIITKNDLVTRDLDLLSTLHEQNCVRVNLSITTLDQEICREMEPRTSQPHRRLKAVKKLADRDIPVRVMVAPVIPGLTDHELPRILERAAEAGATSAGYVPLRLPHGVKDLFLNWLEEVFPEKKNKITNRIRSMRDGALNDSSFHSRMEGSGVFAEQMKSLYQVGLEKSGLSESGTALTTSNYSRPGPEQLSMFP